MREAADAILLDSKFKNRYKLFGYMNNLEMMMAAGASSLVVSRAGSSLFEIASWGKASVIIPIANSNENHQVKNAFAYNEEGACSVIQEENLKPHIFTSEIDRIIEKPEIRQSMEEAAKRFFKPNAADKIATELLSIVLSHENLD
jgi:UDP-N-acetylglucosamine--N-acetylmuramyl-(pentapeptide) pyrophosphoryl-undecaprenol N-acetylglucosamine transferase